MNLANVSQEYYNYIHKLTACKMYFWWGKNVMIARTGYKNLKSSEKSHQWKHFLLVENFTMNFPCALNSPNMEDSSK